MEAKRYLRRYEINLRLIRTNNELIKKKAEDLHRFEQSMLGISAIVYDRDKVQTSPHDSMAEKVARFVDDNTLLDELMELRRENEWLRTQNVEIEQRIKSLEKGLHVAVLTDRYIRLQSFQEIADRLGYSYYYITHIHGEALQEFQKKFCKDSKK